MLLCLSVALLVYSNNLYRSSTDKNGDVLFFQIQVEDKFQLKLNEENITIFIVYM